MKHLSASDKAKFQFGIQEHEQYVFIFPPTYNKQKAIKFTSEISTFEIENTFVSQALPLGLPLVWALMQVHTLKTAQHHAFVCRLLWWDAPCSYLQHRGWLCPVAGSAPDVPWALDGGRPE